MSDEFRTSIDLEGTKPTSPLDISGKDSTHENPISPIERCREWCTLYRSIEIFLIIGTLIICIVFGVQMINLYDINEDFIDYDAGHGPLLLNMIGDSLINHPFHWFNFPEKINFFLNYQFTIGNYGEDGQEIHQIAARINTAIYNATPDCLILFWDSDCSNINPYVLTVQQNNLTLFYYQRNLSYVINATLFAGVKYMAVAGPELLGESQFLLQHLFWHRVNMLNQYRTMNEEITREWNVTYLDVRHLFLKNLPWYWAFNQWYLTREGEHENARGTRQVARVFGEAIKGWLEGYNSSYLTGPSPEGSSAERVKVSEMKERIRKKQEAKQLVPL